jgi:peptidoglycan/xylan/chitin deacetylase (PgdA/CDA1 family)
VKKLIALIGLLFLLPACASASAFSDLPGATPTPLISVVIDVVEPEALPTVSPTSTATPFYALPVDPRAKRTPFAATTRFIPTPFPSPTRPAVRETRVPILMYHHIAVPPVGADAIRTDLSVWPEHFEGHLAALAALGYHSVKLADVYDAVMKGSPLPTNPIVFTFDDGYDDNFTYALPLLEKYGFIGTFYIPTGLLERPGYMTWGQVLELAKAGMDIESHTVSHPSLKNKPVDFLRRELGDSKHALETMLGHPVLFFCYPSGQYDPLTIEILQETGYLSATTTWGGAWQNEALPYEWPRVRIHGSDQAPTVLSRLKLYLGR